LKRNILIFHSGALGDFIITWPLAVALGRIFAQNRIIYVTASQKGELARNLLNIEAVDSEQGWHHLFAADAELPPLQSSWLSGANLIISFVAEPDDVWFENVHRLAPDAKIVCICPRPEGDYAGHVTQFILDQLQDLPMVRQGAQQLIAALAQRPLKTLSRNPTHYIVHPGAGSPQKCWPVEKYLELIQQLQQGGKQVRVLLGEAERERWPTEQIARFEVATETLFLGTYRELLDRLKQAAVFIGNDSGPSHLAAILGIPTLTIFQSSNPDQWRPIGPHVQILNSPTVLDVHRATSQFQLSQKSEARAEAHNED
jgi:ADP-heptose:LPS heptosyltransferase